jgi:hypothetical protein
VHRVFLQMVCLALLCPAWITGLLHAASPAASLLPPTTRGYVSVPSVTRLEAAWDETQLGHLFRDPALRPFLDDLLPKLQDQASEIHVRFAVTWEDLRQVASGEVCLACTEPSGRDTHALVMLVDVSEHSSQARQLLTTIQQRMRERRAAQTVETRDGISVTSYRLPLVAGELEERRVFVALHQGQLLATDHPVALAEVLHRWKGKPGESLAAVEAFQATLQRTTLEGLAGTEHVQWFVEPLGFARVVRAANGGRLKRGTDMLQILENQGFDGLQGVGGRLALGTGEHELLHRTFVHAPGPRRGAARMLDFPNGGPLGPAAWVPHNVANFVSLRWNMAEAFEHSKSFVNELAGADFFDEFLDNLENDPNGPRVNLRRDLVRHLGSQITVISDCTRPITPQSERFIVAVEVLDTEAVARTVHQTLQSDPTACKHAIEGYVVWEIVQEEPEEELTLTVEFSGAGFQFGAIPEPEEEDESASALPQSAITVVDGRLLVSSHVEYLAEVLRGLPTATLAEAAAYRRVDEALERLGGGHESVRLFSRADEAVFATYELIRSGRMPESESLLGKLLNRLKQTDGTAVLRKQEIDGTQLPDFEQVRQYLGPAGGFVESFDDGWRITGCLLQR